MEDAVYIHRGLEIPPRVISWLKIMRVLPSSFKNCLLINTNVEALKDKAMPVCKYNPSNSRIHSGAAIITTVRTVEVLQ